MRRRRWYRRVNTVVLEDVMSTHHNRPVCENKTHTMIDKVVVMYAYQYHTCTVMN